MTTTHQGTTPEQSRPSRNEHADRLLGILDAQRVDGPVAQLLDAALDHARKEGREEAVREVRAYFRNDSPGAITTTRSIRRILDATEPERPTASEEER